ncbi:unnamed protein product [Lactuca virosa]|uniref:Uncharacterized protein n=1 Tax=Lactuca virosa TaxID=75947 RepID=A0AAU9LSU6_9ASTR|nr:unnamed protein product [Lactuca virosa]
MISDFQISGVSLFVFVCSFGAGSFDFPLISRVRNFNLCLSSHRIQEKRRLCCWCSSTVVIQPTSPIRISPGIPISNSMGEGFKTLNKIQLYLTQVIRAEKAEVSL